MQSQKIRNVAIIAHVDHGKTTLVDGLLRQSGTFSAHAAAVERVMDNMDLEKERGITIAAKNCSLMYKDYKINLVDTPGHSDFGGEVERSLMMVDGAVLLVDASEGPLPQTRFVLQKALQRNISMILMINKVDRADARISEVEDMVSDLFLEFSADSSQLDFPILYASGRDGWCSRSSTEKGGTLEPLFEIITEHIPPPPVKPEGEGKFLINNLSYNSYLGRLAIGRIEEGTFRKNQPAVIIKENQINPVKIINLRCYQGLAQQEVEELSAGDIAIIACGTEDLTIGDTIGESATTQPLPRIVVDPPTVTVEVSVNTSPLSGKEGKYFTSRNLHDFLIKEGQHNVSLRIGETEQPEIFALSARGELQIAIVIENLRRLGGECMVGRPRVILQDGQEPIERVVLDIPEGAVGVVTEKLSLRKGKMTSMEPFSSGRMRLEFRIPTRGLLGYRSAFMTDTKGEGLMSSYFECFEAYHGDFPTRINGALISDRTGNTTIYALGTLEERGKLFIVPGEVVYEGMVIGEHNRENDLHVNTCREKKLTNMRSAGTDENIKLTPIQKFTLERALDWIADNEWIEVTPKSIRIRKK
jgi:GTP-binding protein